MFKLYHGKLVSGVGWCDCMDHPELLQFSEYIFWLFWLCFHVVVINALSTKGMLLVGSGTMFLMIKAQPFTSHVLTTGLCNRDFEGSTFS